MWFFEFMKNIFFIFFFCVFFSNSFGAEIVDNVLKEEKKFGDWTIVCQRDVMSDKPTCRIFSSFFNDSASVYIQPNNKVANQVVIIIPSAIEKTKVIVKVDKNNLITSDPIDKKNGFGIVPFSPYRQKLMLSELKTGQDMYIRFTVRDPKVADGIGEITAKISLVEFSKLLVYYDMKMNNSK